MAQGFSFRGFGGLRKRLLQMPGRIRAAELVALKKIAVLAEREMKLNIRNRGGTGSRFKPNALTTTLLKRSSSPLIRNADLMGSITSQFEVSLLATSVFVGVLRTKRARDGQSMANIAAIHEFGTKPFVIPVTDGIRRLFLALFFLTGGAIKPLSARTPVIVHPGHPPRPFIRPAAVSIQPATIKILLDTFKKAI